MTPFFNMLPFDEDGDNINLSEINRFSDKYYLGKTLSSGKFNAVACGRHRKSSETVIIKAIYNPYYRKLKEANF